MEYDKTVDVFYIGKEKYDYAYSIPFTSEMIIDFNAGKEIIGVEILDITKITNITSTEILKLKKATAQIEITKNNTYITLTFYFPNDDTYKIKIVPLPEDTNKIKNTKTTFFYI